MATIINCGGGTMTNCPFPIGYGGFFQIDPNTLYSGTKWQQKKDVFILAAGDTYPAGSTGGEAQHALTKEEMPAHRHVQRIQVTSLGIASIIEKGTDGQGGYTGTAHVSQQGWIANAKAIETDTSGSGASHNNMPPYYSMPFWIRTA